MTDRPLESLRPTIFITQGLPASGKTTAARELDALRLNLDDYRNMMGFPSGSNKWSREKENVAKAAMVGDAKCAIQQGFSIVLDNCHVTPSLPRIYRRELGWLGVAWKVIDLTNVSVDECIARDALRGNAMVGESVIRRLASDLEKSRKDNWHLTEEWLRGTVYPKPLPYVPDATKPIAYICDIDGTVAINNGHRGHYDYDESVLRDEPNMAVIHVIRELAARRQIIFVSGREDRCREDTEAWLNQHICDTGWFVATPLLFMRKTGDHRPDYVIKAELFDAHIRDQYNVIGVFDDRDQVVRMWRDDLGLTAFQVNWGNF